MKPRNPALVPRRLGFLQRKKQAGALYLRSRLCYFLPRAMSPSNPTTTIPTVLYYSVGPFSLIPTHRGDWSLDQRAITITFFILRS